ncbi:hypothetical protein OIDMADRAFT_24348 [Oidiodendron maius Zn]|uniref:Uncharacterized protein n=1 Tax=Oidiodendron maius (strain Zn) TaxID=913774 RepID=A0A0C3HCG4_OIDMZ|nr:hypothetical protein OIDMADRAFT_24348 [Oidiodendron maius Zn]
MVISAAKCGQERPRGRGASGPENEPEGDEDGLLKSVLIVLTGSSGARELPSVESNTRGSEAENNLLAAMRRGVHTNAHLCPSLPTFVQGLSRPRSCSSTLAGSAVPQLLPFLLWSAHTLSGRRCQVAQGRACVVPALDCCHRTRQLLTLVAPRSRALGPHRGRHRAIGQEQRARWGVKCEMGICSGFFGRGSSATRNYEDRISSEGSCG